MGPCTFVVTAVVTGEKGVSPLAKVRSTFAKQGIKGFYPGGSAIAFRQATNWASRQGFTDATRSLLLTVFHGDRKDAKLTPGQEVMSGIIGGAISCWNHPFEVARIEMQARSNEGAAKMSMMQVFKQVHQEYGVPGLFKGVVPRLFLGIWQTLFMVTGAQLVKDYLPK